MTQDLDYRHVETSLGVKILNLFFKVTVVLSFGLLMVPKLCASPSYPENEILESLSMILNSQRGRYFEVRNSVSQVGELIPSIRINQNSVSFHDSFSLIPRNFMLDGIDELRQDLDYHKSIEYNEYKAENVVRNNLYIIYINTQNYVLNQLLDRVIGIFDNDVEEMVAILDINRTIEENNIYKNITTNALIDELGISFVEKLNLNLLLDNIDISLYAESIYEQLQENDIQYKKRRIVENLNDQIESYNAIRNLPHLVVGYDLILDWDAAYSTSIADIISSENISAALSFDNYGLYVEAGFDYSVLNNDLSPYFNITYNHTNFTDKHSKTLYEQEVRSFELDELMIAIERNKTDKAINEHLINNVTFNNEIDYSEFVEYKNLILRSINIIYNEYNIYVQLYKFLGNLI